MATQDEIDRLGHQISAEQESARLLDEQIAKEQENTAQRVSKWQDQARRHRDTAIHMQQSLEGKRQELQREQEHAEAVRRQEEEKSKERAVEITDHLLF